MWSSNALSSPPPPAGTTFDPATVQSSVLTNNDLTATHSSGGDSWNNAYSTTSYTTGKKYCEVTINVVASPANWSVIGVATSDWVIIGTGSNLGSNAGGTRKSVGFMGTGAVQIDAVDLTGTPLPFGYTTGNVVATAVDLGAKLIWFKNISTASAWNNGGAADPGTGVGGLDISAMFVSPPYYFGVTVGFLASAGVSSTVNFGRSAYAAASPSGYGNW